MKVSIIGAGYVGIPSGVCYAQFGHDVTIIDKDTAKIEVLRSGKCPLYEDGVESMMLSYRDRLHYETDLTTSSGADIIIIAVGTPSDGDGKANMSYVESVLTELKTIINDRTIVAIKSTVPVGTNKWAREILGKGRVISLPEFLREGTAVSDFINQDRIVCGRIDPSVDEDIIKLYGGKDDGRFLFVSPESSELIKYASNAFLAVRLHYVNELADACEMLGADIDEVTAGMGRDRRIGLHFLNAGPGYGGSCFPKDTRALLDFTYGNMELVSVACHNNVHRQLKIGERIKAYCHENDIHKIAVWGLAFKNNTDDIRESPALNIIDCVMKDQDLDITVYDPAAMDNSKSVLGERCKYAKDMYECADGAELLLVLTEWTDFRDLDWGRMNMSKKTIMDYRGVIDRTVACGLGYDIYTVGVGFAKGEK